MEQKVGWAEPGCVIGQPRIQKVDGFQYLYAEQMHVHETEVGNAMGVVMGRLGSAWERIFGKAPSPPMLVMFIDLDEPRMYDVQAGYVVPEGTTPQGETQVRYVPPALVASMLVWGDLSSVPKSYAPLMEFMNAQGLKCIEGWREWYLLFESDSSMNNVTWVQHVAEELHD